MRITGTGGLLFAATLIALGLFGLIQGGLGAIWQPVPKDLPFQEPLAYLCAIVSLIGGAGLLAGRFALPAARLLSTALLLWILAFRAPAILRAPLSIGSWENCAETTVIASAAIILAGRPGIARALYGLSMIVFGLAHFGYLSETASLVPGWLPEPVAWAGFTGGAYIAAGLAVLSGRRARLAAMLSALQMGGFTLLVWMPIITASGPKTDFQWNETVLSGVLTLAGWVIAESYKDAGMPRSMIALQSRFRGKIP